HDANVAGQWIGQGVAVGRLGNGPASKAIQFRLGIEAFHVAGAADHEQPDDAFSLGGEVWPAIGRRPAPRSIGPSHAVALQHGPQCQAGEPHADVGQEGTAVDAGALPHDFILPRTGRRAFFSTLPVPKYAPRLLLCRRPSWLQSGRPASKYGWS